MGCTDSKAAPAKTQKNAPPAKPEPAKPAAKKEEPKAAVIAPAPAAKELPKEAPPAAEQPKDAPKPLDAPQDPAAVIADPKQPAEEPKAEEPVPAGEPEAPAAAAEEVKAQEDADANPKDAEAVVEASTVEGPVTLRMVRLSTNCIAPWVVLDRCGIEHTIADVDLMGGETRNPEYLAMNPMHCVPTLSTGDFHLWESNAVMRFICNNYPAAQAFYPSDPEDIALTELALDFKQTMLAPNVSKVTYSTLGFGSFTEEEQAEARKKLSEGDDSVFAVIEKKFLNGRAFVGGDVTSVADLALVTGLKFLDIVDFEYPEAINAYIARVSAAVDLPKYYGGGGDGSYGVDAHFASVRAKQAAAAEAAAQPAAAEPNPADDAAAAEPNPTPAEETPAEEEPAAPAAPAVEEEAAKPEHKAAKPTAKTAAAVKKPATKATPKPVAKASAVKKPAAKK